MEDRDFIARFIAFKDGPDDFDSSHDLDEFMNKKMSNLSLLDSAKLDEIEANFVRSIATSIEIFSTDAFRKRYAPNDTRNRINKTLFETWTTAFSSESQESLNILTHRKEVLKSKFIELMSDKKFDRAISRTVGLPESVKYRHQKIAQIIKETLQHDQEN
jgi:hypothetical protein